mgnify:CR=1 FL=1
MNISAVRERFAGLFKDKKQRRRSMFVILSFVLYAVVITMIFAYYSSTDTVTNHISGKNIGLELYEPEWDTKGVFLAEKSEPGMTIPKDPYAVNTGEMDEVVRLKLEITLDESTAQLPSGNDNIEGMITAATDDERKIAILKSILFSDDTPLVTIAPYESQTESGNNIKVDDSQGSSYFMSYNGSGFLIEDASTSSNKFVLYFYYIGDNHIGGTEGYTEFTRAETTMEILKPGEATPRLFNKLVYPIYKKDYLTVFDQGYDIKISAEGIPVKEFGSRPVTVEVFKQIEKE